MKKTKEEIKDEFDRLYELAKARRIVLNKDEWAKKLGKSRSQIHKISVGDHPNLEYLLQKAEALVYETDNVSLSGKPEEKYGTTHKGLKRAKAKSIPFYDAEASAGIVETEMNPIHAPAGTIDVGDLLNDSQAAIRIYGNSMIPNYPPGCVVGLLKVSDSFIEPGEVYVIETRDRRLLKRLFYKEDDPESPYLHCVSDNTMIFQGGGRHGKLAYPPFNLPKEEVISIFAVTGVIKRNSNSVIINR